jgi:hypothetical protein
MQRFRCFVALLLSAQVAALVLPGTSRVGASTIHSAASVAARTVSPTLKTKGKLGSGPKISLKKKKRKTEAQISDEKRITELARRSSTQKKKPSVGGGRQHERYTALMSQSATRCPIFARGEEEEWTDVGYVCVAKGSATTMEQAARLQKRVILEHAAKMHPLLLQQKGSLEAGLGEEETVAGSGHECETAPEVMPVDTSLPDFSAESAMRLAATCGFQGLPIPDRGHYWKEDYTPGVSDRTKDGEDAMASMKTATNKVLGLHNAF